MKVFGEVVKSRIAKTIIRGCSGGFGRPTDRQWMLMRRHPDLTKYVLRRVAGEKRRMIAAEMQA